MKFRNIYEKGNLYYFKKWNNNNNNKRFDNEIVHVYL